MTDWQQPGTKGQLLAIATIYNSDMNQTTAISRPTIQPRIVVLAALVVCALLGLFMLLGAALGANDPSPAKQHAAEDRSLFYCIEDSAGPSWLPEEAKKEIVQACVDQLATTP